MYRRFPRYPDDADYQTNAPSYYEDLAKKQKLIQLLAEKIWDYDERLDERLEDLENVLQDYLTQWDERIENLDDEVSDIFVTWLEDGTLEKIINHDVLGNKADKSFVDDELEKVHTHFGKIENELLTYGINVSNPPNDYTPVLGNGEDETEAIQQLADLGYPLIFPKTNQYYLISGTIDLKNSVYGLNFPEIRMTYETNIDYTQFRGKYRIFRLTNIVNSQTEITGLVLNGNFDSSLPTASGGGITEHNHAISIAGCENITIHNNIIKNNYGDGIYLGNKADFDNPTIVVKRINKNITIRDNKISNNHRCAISPLAVDNILIVQNELIKANTYVALIDIEPEDDGSYVKDITIEKNELKTLDEITTVLMYAKIVDYVDYIIKNVKIISNTFDGVGYAIRTSSYHNINEILIDNNSFIGEGGTMFIGGDIIKKTTISNNTFEKEKMISPQIHGGENLIFTNNYLNGKGYTTFGLSFTSPNFIIKDNIFNEANNTASNSVLFYRGADMNGLISGNEVIKGKVFLNTEDNAQVINTTIKNNYIDVDYRVFIATQNVTFDVLFTDNQVKGLTGAKFTLNSTDHVIRTGNNQTSVRGGSITLLPKNSNPIQIFNRPMTSHATVTLSKQGVTDGDTFTISRVDSSEIHVYIKLEDDSPLITLNSKEWCEVIYFDDVSEWVVVKKGMLD